MRRKFFDKFPTLSAHMFGDDTARYPFLLEASLSPYAADAIKYALETAADSGRIEGIDMVDEVSSQSVFVTCS